MIEAQYATKEASYFEDDREEMLRFVPPTAQTVLEIGCGSAAFAALLKSKRKVHITAVEPFAGAAEKARSRVDRLVQCSIEEAAITLQGEEFDCVILNDVLEHLTDPWEVLRQLRPLISARGVLIASVPNCRYLPVFMDYVLRGRWTYRQTGVMDRTHLRFFTQASLKDLFGPAGFSMNEATGINPTNFSWKFAAVNLAFGGALDDTRYKQFACIASPAK